MGYCNSEWQTARCARGNIAPLRKKKQKRRTGPLLFLHCQTLYTPFTLLLSFNSMYFSCVKPSATLYVRQWSFFFFFFFSSSGHKKKTLGQIPPRNTSASWNTSQADIPDSYVNFSLKSHSCLPSQRLKTQARMSAVKA